jgi:hypothetical protein
MRRVLIALFAALIGVALAGGSAMAAGPEQRGGEKWFRRGGERIRVAAEALEMTPREVARALREGRTIADLAEAQGVALSEIDAALARPYEERLAREVADGVLTQAQADYLAAEAAERRQDFLTQRPRRARFQPHLEALAAALETSEEALAARIEGGERVAEIVAASGLGVETVVERMAAFRQSELQERVALDLMTETQMNRRLRVYEQRLSAWLGRG